MNFITMQRCVLGLTGLLTLSSQGQLPAQPSPDLAQQIAEIMSHGPSGRAHKRLIHAKGIVCEGSFVPSPGGGSISGFSFSGEPSLHFFGDGEEFLTFQKQSQRRMACGLIPGQLIFLQNHPKAKLFV